MSGWGASCASCCLGLDHTDEHAVERNNRVTPIIHEMHARQKNMHNILEQDDRSIKANKWKADIYSQSERQLLDQ